MDKNIMFRHEHKYRCSAAQIEIIKSRLDNLLEIDKHAPNGQYTIRSIYFDNYKNKCYFENENGTDPREKFRIRIYNSSDERISLECKRKEKGKTHKTACLINKEQFYRLMNGEIIDNLSVQNPLIIKFNTLIQTQLYKPVIIVEYDRTPYVYKDGNVRITFDKNIRFSTKFDAFFDNDLPTMEILSSGQHLIEVKYDEFLPSFIKDIMEINALSKTTFSKYYLCRRISIGGLL